MYNGDNTKRVTYSYGNNGSVAQITDYFANSNTRFVYDLAERVVSQREYTGTGKSDLNLISYTDFTYADKTNYLTGITHFSPLGTQKIGYTYGNIKTGYMPDQVYCVNWNDELKLQNYYDNLGRVTRKSFNGNKDFGTVYTYENVGSKETSTLIKSIKTPIGTYTYEYDKLGNITSVTDGTSTVSYEYDSLNQLTRVNDEKAGKTITYSYTNGNITEQKEYEYTTGELGEEIAAKTWNYTDSTWSDLLTNFNGTQITYDEIGNPLTIGSKNLTWLGRQLQSITDGEKIIEYAYNGDGNRVSKTVNGVKTEFIYNGDILAGQITGDDKIVFMYDNKSDIFGFIYNDTEYYYIKNAQNDVIAIADENGNVLVNYTYDPWGKVISITDKDGNELLQEPTVDETATTVADELITKSATVDETTKDVDTATKIAFLNPIRYRSYYYDSETEWYYLKTRYYSPDMCRFINADGYVQTGQGMLDKNMFAYCENNPSSRIDAYGDSWSDIKNWFSNAFSRTTQRVKNLFSPQKPQNSNIQKYSPHKKKGTTSPHNKPKHEGGETRRNRDAGGEKGDKRRKPNPNKRRPAQSTVEILETVEICVVAIVVTVGIIYIVANDATVIGVIDDALIAPLGAILWECSAKIIA